MYIHNCFDFETMSQRACGIGRNKDQRPCFNLKNSSWLGLGVSVSLLRLRRACRGIGEVASCGLTALLLKQNGILLQVRYIESC